MKTYKILMLADNPLNTSGVGCQAFHLINGLLKKDRWSFRVFGAAIKHESYDPIVVDNNPNFIVKPIDGFGTQELLRDTLIKERPDALFLFTDPRFFPHVWNMEDEIHQVCPIVYWHVWDSDPWPEFNRAIYESTDLINCHSHLTYSLVKDHFPERTNFIPHALPPEIFQPLSRDDIAAQKVRILGQSRADHIVCIWVNRNARRKMPGNVLYSWKLFLDQLEAKHGHRNATLLMHTNPYDIEGQNLVNIADAFKISDNIVYSTSRVNFAEMSVLYNISDYCINIASFEGFGLSTLEAMQCGIPIIALKTGGLTRQVVDHRDDTENGIALHPELRNLVGGQDVPYIWEDHVTVETVAAAHMKMYEMDADDRRKLGMKARAYVESEFRLSDTIDAWDRTLYETIRRWKHDRAQMYTPWEIKTI